MQQTRLSCRDAACGTADRGYLLGLEVAVFHSNSMRLHAVASLYNFVQVTAFVANELLRRSIVGALAAGMIAGAAKLLVVDAARAMDAFAVTAFARLLLPGGFEHGRNCTII
jgi:hypothetical protein